MRITLQVQRVLESLLANEDRYGLQICEDTRLPAGTVYPIMARLERAGWVESRWEDAKRHEEEGRPRRRYYQLTSDGSQLAREAMAVTYRAGRRTRLEPDPA